MRIRTAVFLVLSVVAVSAAAFAQSDNPSLLEQILQTLGVIGKQTAAIEGQVTNQDTGLPAVQGSLVELDTTVAGVDSRIDKLADNVGTVREAIDDIIDIVERPRPSAHRLWVSPFWADQDTGGGSRAHLLHVASMVVLNPGNETARVGCLFFDAGGAFILDRGTALTLGRGATGECTSMPDTRRLGRGWMVIRSDQPVLTSTATTATTSSAGRWISTPWTATTPR
jgi:hypothetical protein